MPIPSDSLAAHYTFNSNGNDSSGNGRHLTASGTPTFVAGHLGNAAQFSDSAYYQLASASFLDELVANRLPGFIWAPNVSAGEWPSS